MDTRRRLLMRGSSAVWEVTRVLFSDKSFVLILDWVSKFRIWALLPGIDVLAGQTLAKWLSGSLQKSDNFSQSDSLTVKYATNEWIFHHFPRIPHNSTTGHSNTKPLITIPVPIFCYNSKKLQPAGSIRTTRICLSNQRVFTNSIKKRITRTKSNTSERLLSKRTTHYQHYIIIQHTRSKHNTTYESHTERK